MAGSRKKEPGRSRKQDPHGAPEDVPRQQRLGTGIKRLDDILSGGFLRGSAYALLGPPGAGKTILYSYQVAFHHVATGGRCLYLTLLVESHGRLLGHLRPLAFFREALVPEGITYLSGYRPLKESGLEGLLAFIRRTLRQHKPTLFVIDGFESVGLYAPDERERREFIHGIQTFTEMLGCTTLLASLTGEDRAGEHPENAVVDGVLELTDELRGPRAVRELTVHKFRGSRYLRGRHEVEITGDGMIVHPRTEVQFSEPPAHATEERLRMAFGVPRLDAMMEGGLPSGSTATVLGAPGTGKTLLGLHFLVEGARNGQKGLYFGFYEPPPRLIEKASSVGLELARYVEEGTIELVWQAPLERMLDSLAEQVLERVKTERPPRRRLFIDGLEGFRTASVYPERMPRFLSAFTNQLRTSDVTTLISEELDVFRPTVDMPVPALASVVETVILLRYVELRSQLHRLLSILKMRESRYDTSIREFRIEPDGIRLEKSFESAEAVLTGSARVRGDPDVGGGR